MSHNGVAVPKWMVERRFNVDHGEPKSAFIDEVRVGLAAKVVPNGFEKTVSEVKDTRVVRNVGQINHGEFHGTLSDQDHELPKPTTPINPCAGSGKRHPRAYIGVAGGADWPYSVAWISQRLAEPLTRVRIAVGPLNHVSMCFAWPILKVQAWARWRTSSSNF